MAHRGDRRIRNIKHARRFWKSFGQRKTLQNSITARFTDPLILEDRPFLLRRIALVRTKIFTPIHQEISLLGVLYIPNSAVTPITLPRKSTQRRPALKEISQARSTHYRRHGTQNLAPKERRNPFRTHHAPLRKPLHYDDFQSTYRRMGQTAQRCACR
jgi:hypothetical protein